MVRRTIHQRQELKSAMRKAHNEGVEVYDLGKIVIKKQAKRPGLWRPGGALPPVPCLTHLGGVSRRRA